jgi:hypothetical protein
MVGSCEHGNDQSGSLDRDQDNLPNGLNLVGLFFSLRLLTDKNPVPGNAVSNIPQTMGNV